MHMSTVFGPCLVLKAPNFPTAHSPGVTPHSLRTWKMLPAVLKPCRRVAEVRKGTWGSMTFQQNKRTSFSYCNYCIWLVVWNMNFIFHSIWDVILPIDELIFFKMVKTTNQVCTVRVFCVLCVCFKMRHSKNHEEWGEWGLSAARHLRSFYKQGTGRGYIDVVIWRRSPGSCLDRPRFFRLGYPLVN